MSQQFGIPPGRCAAGGEPELDLEPADPVVDVPGPLVPLVPLPLLPPLFVALLSRTWLAAASQHSVEFDAPALPEPLDGLLVCAMRYQRCLRAAA